MCLLRMIYENSFKWTIMWDTNTRQTEQIEFYSPHQFRPLSGPNSASPYLNSVSPRPISVLPSSARAPSRTPSVLHHSDSISSHSSSASYLRDSVPPCPQKAVSQTVSSCSQQNQTRPAKRVKRQLSETRTVDAVDEAILNLVEKRTSTVTMNSDDLFYLSISRDSHLNVNAKLRLKTLVLQALSQIVAEKENKT